MIYIEIDENRMQINSASTPFNLNNPLYMDNEAPSPYHTVKVDWMNFSGEEQWELNLTLKQKQIILAAQKIYNNVIDSVTNSVLIDQLQLAAGEITQAVYDTRFTAKAALYVQARTEFYTTTGLTVPTIQE